MALGTVPLSTAAAGAIALVAAVLLAGVAVAALRAGPRRPANQLFALFLLLIAGNAVTDGLTKWGVADPVLLRHLGFAFLALDPGVLLYFTLVYPRRSPLLDRPLVAPALLAMWSAAAVVAVFFAGPFTEVGPRPVGQLALILYMGGLYLVSYAMLLARFAEETSPTVLAQLAGLLGAMGFALLSRIGLIPVDLWTISVYPHLIGLPLAFGLFAFAAFASLRATPLPARLALARAHRTTLAGLAVVAVFLLLPLAVQPFLGAVAAAALGDFTSSAVFFLRWVGFTALVGSAMLHYQVLDLDVRVTQVVQVSSGIAAVVVLVAVAWWLGGAASGLASQLTLGQALAVALAAVAAGPVARVASAWASEAMPRQGPQPDRALRKVEIYRAAVEAALGADGQVPPAAARDLEALRRDLGLSEEQHRVVVDLVRGAQGWRLEDEQPLRPGARFRGRYDVLADLGRGGEGTALRARDRLLGRDVVIKVIRNLPGQGGQARGLREARVAGAAYHPHVVTVHDAWETPSASYVVMEYVVGGDLRRLLAKGPLGLERAGRVLDELLQGLEAVHARGIAHGDLKPENVLLDGQGRVKLADFGAARAPPSATGATLASLPSRSAAGTLPYMAPEQVRGDPGGPAADLYATAAVAYELFTSEHYLDLRGKGDFELREAILRAPPRLPRGDLPAAVQEWLQRGLAKEPGERWPDAAAMRAALAEALAVVQPSTVTTRRRRMPRRKA